MTPIRRRFFDDLRVRNLAPHTRHADVRVVARFERNFHHSPDQFGREQVREYLLHLVRLGRAWDTYNQARCALHFFDRVTLGKNWPLEQVPASRCPKG